MGQIAQIWRHPIKSHGREALGAVDLNVGQTLPWDRCWAVAHEAAKLDGDGWAPCANFSRGAKAPGLMAITAEFDISSGKITLRHPDLPALCIDPDTEGDKLIAWSAPLIPDDRAQSAHVMRAADRGMTDTPFPSISLNSTSSLRALGQKLGRPLQPERFRGNFWIDGLGPWEEFEWIGKTLRIGTAELKVEERIGRCRATMANPETGRTDADTLGALEDGWGHRDFGVYAQVVTPGTVALGDEVELR